MDLHKLYTSTRNLKLFLENRQAIVTCLNDILPHIESHLSLFTEYYSQSSSLYYIQSYQQTVDLILMHLESELYYNKTIKKLLDTCHPNYLMSHCIVNFKKDSLSNIVYENALVLVLYTLQPNILNKIFLYQAGTNSVLNLNEDIGFMNPIQSSFSHNLCSLPDLITNRLSVSLVMNSSNKDYISSPIYPLNYYKLLSNCIAELLIVNQSKNSIVATDTSLIILLAGISSKICTLGHSEALATSILGRYTNNSHPNTDCSLERYFSYLSLTCYESLLESLFFNYYREKLEEDRSIFQALLRYPLDNRHLKNILLNNFFLYKCYTLNQVQLLHNLIHYLTVINTQFAFKAFKNIISSLKSEHVLMKISLEQHIHTSRALILFTRYLDKSKLVNDTAKIGKTSLEQNDYDPLWELGLFEAINNYIHTHLQHSRESVRLAGLVCGEIIMNWLDYKKLDHTLTFELPQDNYIIKELTNLCTCKIVRYTSKAQDINDASENNDIIPKGKNRSRLTYDEVISVPNTDLFDENLNLNGIQELLSTDNGSFPYVKMTVDSNNGADNKQHKRPLIEILSDEDTSDTEDLQPHPSVTINTQHYIQEEMKPLNKEVGNGPYYLRECLEWIRGEPQEEHYVAERKAIAAFNNLESLIRSQQDDLKVWAPDLVKQLLHMQDKYSIENQNEIAVNSLIALCVHDPEKTAKYLTGQFYESNNVTSVRYDVLHVLTNAALELANLKEANCNFPSSNVNMFPIKDDSTNKNYQISTKFWEEEINMRLKSKTRIISRGPTKSLPVIKNNKFSIVAGYFFYPLLNKYDINMPTLQLMGKDDWLFSKLLHSLGTFIYCCEGSTVLRNMLAALFDFLMAISYTKAPSIVQGICFCSFFIYNCTPGFMLLSEFSEESTQLREIVYKLKQNNSDINCFNLANLALLQFRNVTEQAVGNPNSIM